MRITFVLPFATMPVVATLDLIDCTNGVLLSEGADAEVFCAQILAFARMKDDEWRRFSDAAYETAQRHDWLETARKLVATVTAAVDQQSEARAT